MFFFADNFSPSCQVTSDSQNSAQVGKKVRLRCKVTGSPSPTISWLKDDKALQVTGRIIRRDLKNFSTIRIKDVRLDDQGNYTCIAENALGKINATLELNVRQGRGEN